ncbi:hypothetical protein EJB05_22051 [Eragrostis curvula]|uniref:RPM1 interacting protein 13 n=1 Tax=Eragrostis curvula TaxID=38414 RepID=A0A5J9V4T4_9POAL|nr:hypothetical protein EJB05_22051 [Eragrostis curvula]
MAPGGGGVVEISSDEEDVPAGNKLPVDPFGWASGLFDVDGQDDAARDDFDDLMVMSEWSSPPVLQKTTKPDDLVVMNELSSPAVHQKKVKPGGRHDEENNDGFNDLTDDDDCVVLDGDPDKAVTVGEEEGSAGDSSSDELQIVAEKGQLACRDFPHSRHLCSNFPFKSTSHVKYCNMCHCFVCDAPAPCKLWGDGRSVADHCHATDKEGQWKELRQAYKCNSLPASGPGKHQSAACSTMMSPRQQNMQCQFAVPQSIPSLASNMGHHSLSNQSPLPFGVSHNQQRNPSVRVSLCVAGTVSTPRAGRGTGNPHIPQNTHSHAIFKRVGSFPPVRTTTNANRFGSAGTPDNSLMHQALPNVSRPDQVAITNAFTATAQNSAPMRSFSAPIAFQAQQGQPAAYGQVAPNGMNVTGPQFSRCASLTAQRTQCVEEPVIDVSTKSWEDILARVASDLGVPDYNISTAESQHVAANSESVHSTASQGLGLQHEPVESMDSLTSSHVHDVLNNTTGGNVQADGPPQTTESMHHLDCQSSLVPNEAHVNNFASGPADDLAIEAARQLEISALESNIMFEFGDGEEMFLVQFVDSMLSWVLLPSLADGPYIRGACVKGMLEV